MTTDDLPPRLHARSDGSVKHLLDQARRDGPSPEQVAATVAGVVAATGATVGRSALGAAKWLKIAGAIGAAGVVTVGAVLAIRGVRHEPHPASPPIQPVHPVATAVAPPPEPEPATTTREPAPAQTAPATRHAAAAPARASASSSASEGSSMAIELQRVLAIRSRMLAKDPNGALAGAKAYERDYPHGSFVPEAEAMAIEALDDSGRTDEAKARADRFLARYGSSPQAARIRALRERMK
jgi:hypothetical protein